MTQAVRIEILYISVLISSRKALVDNKQSDVGRMCDAVYTLQPSIYNGNGDNDDDDDDDYLLTKQDTFNYHACSSHFGTTESEHTVYA